MTKFDPQKYVTTALSKDAGRGALQHIYRDKTKLIGCDGYRLHMIEKLPAVESPHFLLNDYDGQYPNYEAVIPASDKERYIGKILVSKNEMKRLKGLISFIGTDKNPVVKMYRDEATHRHLQISYSSIFESLPHTAKITIEVEDTSLHLNFFKMGLKLKDLTEVLIEEQWMTVWVNPDMSSIIFRCDHLNTYGLLMACKL
jgi:hypothetical protein